MELFESRSRCSSCSFDKIFDKLRNWQCRNDCEIRVGAVMFCAFFPSCDGKQLIRNKKEKQQQQQQQQQLQHNKTNKTKQTNI